MADCAVRLYNEGRASPRTCARCGLGPCVHGEKRKDFEPDPNYPLVLDENLNQVSKNVHGYLSTACWHGAHERCRRVCKFCQAPCRCSCHVKGG